MKKMFVYTWSTLRLNFVTSIQCYNRRSDLLDNDGLCHSHTARHRLLDRLNGIRVNLWHWDDLGIFFHNVRRKVLLVQNRQSVGTKLVGSAIDIADRSFRKMFGADPGVRGWLPLWVEEIVSDSQDPLFALVRISRKGVSVGDAATCGNEASFSFIHWRKIEQNRYIFTEFLWNSPKLQVINWIWHLEK